MTSKEEQIKELKEKIAFLQVLYNIMEEMNCTLIMPRIITSKIYELEEKLERLENE